MFGRKKYRKGKTYLVMLSGDIFKDGFHGAFFSSTDMIPVKNLDAVQARDWMIDYTIKSHNLQEGTYCFKFYRIEKL